MVNLRAQPIQDIPWLDSLEEAKRQAREQGRPIVLKPLDQGYTSDTHWCYAAAQCRGIALSDPAVATFVAQHFVAVRAALWIGAPLYVDDEAREIVAGCTRDNLNYAGLVAVDLDSQVLGHTHKDAGPAETLAFLQRVLSSRPEWRPADPPTVYDQSDPAVREVLEWEAQMGRARPEERAALVKPIRSWLERHPEPEHPCGPLVRILLGESLYNGAEFQEAEELWREVRERYPEHPLRHRAYYHLLDRETWAVGEHPHLIGAPYPSTKETEAVVPDADRRARLVAEVEADPRYRWSKSGIPFVWIPPGTFTMGGSPAYFPNETPSRRVTLSRGYWMAAWPVTRAMWATFEPEHWPLLKAGDLVGEIPAARVNYGDALRFIDFLSEQDGVQYRLPFETEWERACRGGLEGKAHPWGDEEVDDSRCNTHRPRPVPVACYAPNAYGLFDMVGNCFEWCADHYVPEAYSRTAAEVSDPPPPETTRRARNVRVVRASGCGSPFTKVIARTGWRGGLDVLRRDGGTGVRLVYDGAAPRV